MENGLAKWQKSSTGYRILSLAALIGELRAEEPDVC